MIPQEGQRVRIVQGHPREGVVIQVDFKDETALVGYEKRQAWYSWDCLAMVPPRSAPLA